MLSLNTKPLAQGTASGFVFNDSINEHALLAAVRRAVAAYHDKKIWHALQRNCMGRDFSWGKSAAAYREIYARLMRRQV